MGRQQAAPWFRRRRVLNYLDVEASLRLPIARGGRLVHWPAGWGPVPGTRPWPVTWLRRWWRTGGRP